MTVSSAVHVAHSSSEVLLPSEHMKDVGQSLPELTSELVSAQCAQHTEVDYKEELLKKLKVIIMCQYQISMEGEGLVWRCIRIVTF